MDQFVCGTGIRQIINHGGRGVGKDRIRQLIHECRVAVAKYQTGSGACQPGSNTQTQSLSSARDQNGSASQIDVQVNCNSRISESNSSARLLLKLIIQKTSLKNWSVTSKNQRGP